MKYEIVEFKNSKFGIRRRNFFQNLLNYGGDYYDFYSSMTYFPFKKQNDSYFSKCETNDINLLFEMQSKLQNKFIKQVIK